MKKLVKIVSVLLMVAMVVAFSTTVFAGELTPGAVKGNQDGTTKIQDMGFDLVGILQVIGIIAAVAILIVLGIKYMMGSAEEKAEYKKTMIPYIIGAVFIFGASAIAQVIYDWAITIGQ